jgi:hypothetical protein
VPLPPFPVMPAPRTWSPGDKLYTGRLRNDLRNAALLLANRPLLVSGQTTTAQTITNGGTPVPVTLDTDYVDNWQQHQIPNVTYPVPLGGWYLMDGDVQLSPTAVGAYGAVGFQVSQNGATTTTIHGAVPTTGAAASAAVPTGSVLAQLNPQTSDTVAMVAEHNSSASNHLTGANFKAEWVAQPTSLGYGTGTVVASPQPAALWAPGGGTQIGNPGGIAAGATSMLVASNLGMVVGGYLGLDYYEGLPVSQMAESVTITSIAGNTIGISATLYPHGGSLSPGLVAVPVSAAFLNQQVRDMINFLCYPPIAHLYGPVTTSLAAQTWPAATAITFASKVVDNFSGWSGSEYVFPVSGTYYVYGEIVPTTGLPNISAGLAISGGQIQWGDSIKPPASGTSWFTPTVRRLLRVTAGQYVQLYGSSSIAQNLQTAYGATSRLVVVFRSF